MIGLARQLTRLPGLLALTAAALAGLVAWQISRPPEVPPPSPASAPEAADDAEVQRVAQPFEPRPLESYAGIEARPLFLRSRRPPPPSTAATGGSRGHDTLILAGVILTATKRLAMIETKRTSGVVVVREGQLVEGWSVDRIAPDRVTVSLDDQVVDLLLDDKLKMPRKEVRRTPRTQPLPQPPKPDQAAPAQPAEDAPDVDAAQPEEGEAVPLEPEGEGGEAG